MNEHTSNPNPFLTQSQLDWWASFYASETEEQEGIFESWLIFRLGGERFAVPMERLSEITLVERGVGIRQGSSGILGLINNRGEAVLLADMGQLLGVRGPCESSPEQRVLVFEDTGGVRTGFLVDRIEEVTSLNTEQFQEQRPSRGDPRSRFTTAVTEHKDRGLATVEVNSLLAAIR